MGMAMSGVTHCRKCGRPLSYAEYGKGKRKRKNKKDRE